MLYCPMCFNYTLSINSHGVIFVKINKVGLDNGRFLFNTTKESPSEIYKQFRTQIQNFFKWYSSFHNREEIEIVEIYTHDVSCSDGCPAGVGQRHSVIPHLIPEERAREIIDEEGKKYKLELNYQFQ